MDKINALRKPNTFASVHVLNENKRNHSESACEFVARIEEGLMYHPPELCDEGVNGTYFVKDREGASLAIFKPKDEEGSSALNPKKESKSSAGYGADEEEGSSDDNEESNEHGVLAGEAAAREVAAYLLDREGKFDVPFTSMVEVSYSGFTSGAQVVHSPATGRKRQLLRKKVGSLQAFADNDGSAEDMGSSVFPVKEVHKIGVLDVQIINTDRHEGNILFREEDEGIKLIPIDHGFSLPHTLDKAWFAWLNWPQAKKPFDSEMKEYIDRIDIEKDAKMLEKLGITSDCLRNMRITTTLLKKGAAKDLTLFDIASLICRVSGFSHPSELEDMCQQAQKNAEACQGSEEAFFVSLNQILDNKINEIVAAREATKAKSNGSASSLKWTPRRTSERVAEVYSNGKCCNINVHNNVNSALTSIEG